MNESSGSGGSAVVKALRATEKRMEKSLKNNKQMNNSIVFKLSALGFKLCESSKAPAAVEVVSMRFVWEQMI